MREISMENKREVARQFLCGASYDEIVRRVGIAKGSVVNIVDELREGGLPVPDGTVEYVDSLRRLAVDLKKNATSVAQVTACLRLDAKLKALGVGPDCAEEWLDICRGIATPDVSSAGFVQAALELARLESATGSRYEELITLYKKNLKVLNKLKGETKRRNKELRKIIAEKERNASELNSITWAMVAAQESLQRQRDSLKSELDEHLAQHKLSWKKVETVLAALNRGLAETGLSTGETADLQERIRHTGTLVVTIKQLEEEKARLQSEADRLTQEKQSCMDTVENLKVTEGKLRRSISENRYERDRLNTKLESKAAELAGLERAASRSAQNLYIARLIIDFLFAPDSLSNYDLDRLVNLMVGLRQKRLGIGVRCLRDSEGRVVCQCQVPAMSGAHNLSQGDIDHARKAFAHLLTPLVKDEFISRFDFEMQRIKWDIDKFKAVSEATLDERRRHII